MQKVRSGGAQAPDSSTVFLSTKFAPPLGGRRWVDRVRLIERLGVPPQTRLSLVHAGAGFGKTGALTQWYQALGQAGIRVAWLGLNGDESNLPLFISHVAAAINRVCPEIGVDVMELAARRGTAARPDVLRTTLINAIASLSTPLILIVDDYHLCESSDLNTWVGDFINRAPHNFHLALASRSLPAMSLSRLQASGEVSEIDARELALSFSETRDFIKVAGEVEVLGQDIAVAYTQTEGWVGGLQMIATSLRNQRSAGKTLGKTLATFSGDARAVTNYLRDEVLAYLPSELNDFLQRISILERFCPDLCAAVSDRGDAAELLSQATTRELFILPLDEKGYWHRFHHLFGDFLQAQLKLGHQGEMGVLHQRASAWFVAQGLWHEAMRHALLSGDEAQALAIAEQCAMDLVRDGDYLTLQAMMARLPADQRRHGALLRLSKAWILAVNGKTAEVEQILDEVGAKAGGANYIDEMLAIRAALAYALDDSARIELVLAIWNGQTHSTNLWVGDVLKTIASSNLIWCGRFAAARDFLPCTTPFRRVLQRTFFGWSWLCEGRPAEAESEWQEAVELADSEFGARSTISVLPRVPLARVAYERGEFDAVEMLLAARIGVLEQAGTTDFLNQAVYALSWSRYASGDRGSAIELNERLRLTAIERGMMRLEVHTTVELMRMCWRTQPDRVAHLAHGLHAIVLAAPEGRVRSTRWLATRLAALGVAFHRAMSTVGSAGVSGLGAVVHDIVDVAHGPHTLTAWLLLLIAANEAGDRSLTRTTLTAVLRDGQAYAVERTFVDTGDWLLPLLLDFQKAGAAAEAGISPVYLDHLISRFSPARPIAQTKVATMACDEPPLVEALSKRELEILSLVERGLSNKLICRTLNIGNETVKWHVRNLFGKLSVSNRLQAVNRARALSLLPSSG